MIEIKTYGENEDKFQVICKIEVKSKNEYIKEAAAIIDQLVKADEELFTRALIKSSFYKIVCKATKDMEIVIHEDRKQDTSD